MVPFSLMSVNFCTASGRSFIDETSTLCLSLSDAERLILSMVAGVVPGLDLRKLRVLRHREARALACTRLEIPAKKSDTSIPNEAISIDELDSLDIV